VPCRTAVGYRKAASVSTASVTECIYHRFRWFARTGGEEVWDELCQPDHGVLRLGRVTAIIGLGQASTATHKPFDAEEPHQDEKGTRRVAQMEGALFDDFVLQVTLQDISQDCSKIGINF
jgi:hypothetical protein